MCWGVCEKLDVPNMFVSAFSLDWSEFVATISFDIESSQVCLLRSKMSRAWLAISIVTLGDFSLCPVSSVCVVTLGASSVKSEDSSAGLVRKCAIPWLGDERSVSVD